MKPWDQLADDRSVNLAIESLKANGIAAEVVDNADQAKQKVLSLLPKNAEVMTMSSVTLETIGVTKTIEESDQYNSVKKKLKNMNRETHGLEMQKMGAAPEWAIGSVHAVTEDGKVMIASNTGSQLPAYAYASMHVIWVVGTQKITKDMNEGMQRINEYALPLESKRVKIAYNDPTKNSGVNKVLVVNKEIKPGRITLIFVKEKLGF